MGQMNAALRKNATSVNWLKEELREWAKWYSGSRTESENSGDGFSSTTVLGKAFDGHIQTPPSSCIPHGVEPPYDLRKICHAMINLMGDPRLGWYVMATRLFYLAGENIKFVQGECQCGRAAAYALVERGEDALRAFLRA